jgi:hypothetical protein
VRMGICHLSEKQSGSGQGQEKEDRGAGVHEREPL